MALMHEQDVRKNITSLQQQFGKVLRQYREDRRLSQTQLANRLHYSPSYVSLLESNDRRPTEELVKDIARTLELTPAEETDLLSAAGFSFRDIGSILDRLVEEISIQVPMDLIGLQALRAHLSTAVHIWQEYQRALHDVNFGEFAQADERLTLLLHAVHDDAMKARILLALADLKLTLGQLDEVELLANEADTIIDCWDSKELAQHQPPIDVVVERWRLKGRLHLREGKYNEANDNASQILEILEQISVEQREENLLWNVSFARTHRFLAVICLLQELPDEALRYCDLAEQKLGDPSLAIERLRLQEIRAWALTESQCYDEAIELRMNAQEQWQELDNQYRLARNKIYLADDYRQGYEAHLATPLVAETNDVNARREGIVHVVQEYNQRQHIQLETVTQLYSEALIVMEHAQDQLYVDRTLVGLAAIKRLQAAFTNDFEKINTEIYSTLGRALRYEKLLKNSRHIPTIYDLWAAWSWDQGKHGLALRYFMLELDALKKFSPVEFAQRPQQEEARVLASIQCLSDPMKKSPQISPLQITVREELWKSHVYAILKLLRHSVEKSTVQVIESSHQGPQWLECVIRVEDQPGSRILIQNELSSALSEMMPSGYLPKMADNQMRRYHRLQEITQCAEQQEPQVYQHVFCKTNVMDGLKYDPTRPSVQDRVKTALAISRDNPTAYVLRSADFEVPFAIEIRDDEVLIEVKADELWEKQELAEVIQCYYAKDRPFAEELGGALDQLIAMTNNPAETVAWLQQFQQQEGATFELPSIALGSPIDD